MRNTSNESDASDASRACNVSKTSASVSWLSSLKKSLGLQLTSFFKSRMKANFPVCILKKICKITHSFSSLRRRNFTSVLASCKPRRLERGLESREGGSSQFKGSSCVSKQLKGAQHTHTSPVFTFNLAWCDESTELPLRNKIEENEVFPQVERLNL